MMQWTRRGISCCPQMLYQMHSLLDGIVVAAIEDLQYGPLTIRRIHSLCTTLAWKHFSQRKLLP